MVQQPPGPPPGGMQPPPPPGPPQAPMGAPKPQIDMSALPLADIIAAVTSLIFVIITGVGWYGDSGIHRMGAMGGLGLAVGIIVLLFAAAMIANRYLNFIPMELPSGLIYLGSEGLILLLMFIGLAVKPTTFGLKWPVSWVTWILALIFSLGIGVAGFLKMQES